LQICNPPNMAAYLPKMAKVAVLATP